ncbi:uncharacterized protein FPRO_13547 [Fusarium proliferatum ET1]|uniref:Phosphatidylinositol-specific phospholipase C X domain-containing protein n=1 Tax=Fusarium proliferatum (strain ET1) TaxID=1227346 RepID=A0A1L7W5H9_FUSPR|nr:uncharacterized protein FPRO_13547 [Fusarium proliferatum ET1]CZR47880.1 uncharacterized protein FPRO_13547 [Fusarium proliferatum ET1]
MSSNLNLPPFPWSQDAVSSNLDLPPFPWSQAQPVATDNSVGTQFKPAACDFNGTLFLAWATQYQNEPSKCASSFSFTYWLTSENGWATPTSVALSDSSMAQSHTSVLVVFHSELYALVPCSSPTSSGLYIYKYDGTTFQESGALDSTWNTSVAATVYHGDLHMVGFDRNNGDRINWIISKPDATTISGPESFLPSTATDNSTTGNMGLIVRKGNTGLDELVLIFLADNDSRTVLENTLVNGVWTRTDKLDERGNSGVSATSTPDGQSSWICFKKWHGYSNLICEYDAPHGCWTSNYSMGTADNLECWNEAALIYSNRWLYIIWNMNNTPQTIYYSRRPLSQRSMGSWMGQITDQSVSLADLSIPGTHDSSTYHFSGYGILNSSTVGPYVVCQDMEYIQQLDAGIRYFDLRGGYSNGLDQTLDELGLTVTKAPLGPLSACHSDFNVGLTFADIFEYFYTWLSKHPSEVIIVQVKYDQGENLNQKVSNDLYNMTFQNPLWSLGDTIPRLQDIKGRIQLIRRLPLPNIRGSQGKPFGIDATGWPENKQATIEGKIVGSPSASVKLLIEDQYQIDGDGSVAVPEKLQAVKDFISQVPANSSAGTWCIGYSSFVTNGISNTPRAYATDPINGAPPFNAQLEGYIRSIGGTGSPAKVGTIVMDFPEMPSGNLIQAIVETNDLIK